MISLSSPGKRALIILLVIAVTIVGIAVIFFSGHLQHTKDEHAGHEQAMLPEHQGHELPPVKATGQKSSVWTCSMHPQIQLPGPGKCPICFMDLIELEQNTMDEGRTSLRQITLTEDGEHQAAIAVSPVLRHALSTEVRMTGTVAYDESRQKTITAWTGGRIEKLFVDASGTRVRTGQPLATIYSPELFAAQAELIQAKKALARARAGNLELIHRTAERTMNAARKKLELLGLSPSQITRIEKKRTPLQRITIQAPMPGLVITKDVVEGMYVTTGQPLYTLADLSRVWVILQAYESDLSRIEEGMNASFTSEAYPGHTLTGKIIYIDPVVDARTRTVAVRMEVANPGNRLKPGMFVKAILNRQPHTVPDDRDLPLTIPESAPLITGTRAVVYVAVKGKPGVYEGREIVLGPRAQGRYVVKSGLAQGDLVVTRGAFRIDSALQIMARPSMMNEQIPAESPARQTGQHQHQEQPGEKARETAQSPAPTAEHLPPLFLSKISFLTRDLAAIGRDINSRNMDAARTGYRDFGKKMDALDGTLLPPKTGLVWKELRMLLINDAVLGAEAGTIKRLNQLHALTTRHMTALRTSMDVDGYERQWSRPHPPADRVASTIARLYEAYAPLMEALAHDDPATARTAAARMEKRLQEIQPELFENAAWSATWTPLAKSMGQGLAAILASNNLVDMRDGFEPVSEALITMVSRFGASSPSPLYALSCPMAFENKGATWVQNDEDIRNPYFGAAMFTCGEVTRQLTAKGQRTQP